MAESYINPIYPQGTNSLLSGAISGAQATINPSYIEPIGGQFSQYQELLRRGYTHEQAAPYMTSADQNSFSSSNYTPYDNLSSYNSPASGGTTPTAGGTTSSGLGFPIAGGAYDAEVAARNAGVTTGGSTSLGGVSQSGGTSAGGYSSSSGGSSSGGISNITPVGNLNSTIPTLTNPTYGNNPVVGYQSPTQYQPQNGQGVLQMQQQAPQDAMNQYLNTPGYQLLGDPSYQRYQQSPGYQYAVNQALGQVQQNAASRGLLESGRVMRDMTKTAQGMALQDYGNWWNRQNSLFGDYQNRLAGLAGGDTGATMANQLGQNLGTGSIQTGSNLASLFGNQGTSGLSGVVNTGAAQSNSMQLAGNTQAQINSANQATQLAGATSGIRF